eukprot:NODE_10274_length_341_cov_19.044521_g9363_i0.p2 GENE.NODE_10274_length_341_cov_19.044521_g9363_i0~~NODE_10274_length_341_cov_19.044521_g9363_i0.p2  ORF type:complete len:100 (+),score=33.92 NODE_10274_length_341_cov_19.044521_g9363_i0:24-302(+)
MGAVSKDLFDVTLANYAFWIPIDIVNFLALPVAWQAIFENSFNPLWAIILVYFVHFRTPKTTATTKTVPSIEESLRNESVDADTAHTTPNTQ